MKKRKMVVLGVVLAVVLSVISNMLVHYNTIGRVASFLLYMFFSLMLMMDVYYVCTDQCQEYHLLSAMQYMSIIATMIFAQLTFFGKDKELLKYDIPLFVISLIMTAVFLRLTITHPITHEDYGRK